MSEGSKGPTDKPTCVFFDTTEIAIKDAFPRLGPATVPELSSVAQAIGARLLVTDLTIDETANVWLREFQQTYKAAESKVKPYVTVGEAPDNAALRDRFRGEIASALLKVPLTIVKISVSMDDVLALLGEEVFVRTRRGISDSAMR